MVKKMDGLKISIDNSDENKKTKKKQASSPKRVPKTKKSGSFFSPLVAVIVTALIVGGGIYAWKDREVERSLKDISQNARVTREEFEKRIENLKSKVTGIETENLQLKTSKEELEKKVSYLDGATKLYVNNELGFSFLYPAIFGEIESKTEETANGSRFSATFTDNEKLTFGSVNSEYVAEDASNPLSLIENYGFREDGDRTLYLSAIKDGENEFEIVPARKIDTEDSRAILLDKNSFPDNENAPQIDIGENAGAVVNLNNDNFPGLSFVNSDFSMMTLMDFEAMLATVESN